LFEIFQISTFKKHTPRKKQTMTRVPLVVRDDLPGGTRETYLCSLELKRTVSKCKWSSSQSRRHNITSHQWNQWCRSL